MSAARSSAERFQTFLPDEYEAPGAWRLDAYHAGADGHVLARWMRGEREAVEVLRPAGNGESWRVTLTDPDLANPKGVELYGRTTPEASHGDLRTLARSAAYELAVNHMEASQ